MDSMMDVDTEDPFYARLFARAPVYDLVFACLSPRSLIQVALTCRAAYLAVAAFKSRAFNINRHFSRYFRDPIAFRSLQARTNTLVSGSNALQFLDRSFYPEADLDLYTHPGHSFEVAQYLVEREGYHYAPRESQEPDWKVSIGTDWDGTRRRAVRESRGSAHAYPMTDISGVWTFEKTSANQERLAVQVVEASSSPVETILGFHTTCVMNFISSDAAYSLYPVATFEHQRALGMPTSRHSPVAIKKYIQRGWRIYFMPTPRDLENPAKSPFLMNRVRWVADKHTWVFPLDQTGIKKHPPLSPTSAPLTCDPVLCNGWRLWLPAGREAKGYECHYYPLRTTIFRYNYAIPDEQLQFTIRDWVHQQGRCSHEHVDKEDWVWFDADLLDFLKRE